MERNESSPTRVIISLTPANRAYLDALAAHNELPGGMTEAMNTLVRFARKLAELGVTDRLMVPGDETHEHTTYILPMELLVHTDPVNPQVQ